MATDATYIAFVTTVLVFFLPVSSQERSPYERISKRSTQYTLPELGFNVGELEPYISQATIRAHHGGHHLAYTDKLNEVLRGWRSDFPKDTLANASILKILQKLHRVPERYQMQIRDFGGGYVNHCFYWACMSGNPSGEDSVVSSKLDHDIRLAFGSFKKFKQSFTSLGKSLFGSGYVWLSRGEDNRLVLTVTKNQDSAVSSNLRPILVLDVWEHAYYLQHQFRRLDYINEWWKVVDWAKVERLDLWWYEGDDMDYKSIRDEL